MPWWEKEMRRPCVPRVQSSGSAAGVKAVRRVTAVESEGSSEREMGEKRVSSKALDGRKAVRSQREGPFCFSS